MKTREQKDLDFARHLASEAVSHFPGVSMGEALKKYRELVTGSKDRKLSAYGERLWEMAKNHDVRNMNAKVKDHPNWQASDAERRLFHNKAEPDLSVSRETLDNLARLAAGEPPTKGTEGALEQHRKFTSKNPDWSDR